MKKSESIKNIAGAMLKLQGEIGKAKKNAENPFFKKNYSTLEEVAGVAHGPLQTHGLVITQTLDETDNGPVVETTLIHAESGDYITSSVPVFDKRGDMQGLGSAITYARRYGLAAILGIVQEDDDGNSTSNPPPRTKASEPDTEAHKQSGGVWWEDRVKKITSLEHLAKGREWLDKKSNELEDKDVEGMIKAFDEKQMELEEGKK